jgi:hypothetical protein
VFGRAVLVQHVGVVEGVLTGQHPLRLRPVDLDDPVRDDQRGDRVAGEVRQGSRFRHESVDRDDPDRHRAADLLVRREAAEGGQTSAGDTGGTLDAMIRNSSVYCSGMKCRGVEVRRRRRRTLGAMTG